MEGPSVRALADRLRGLLAGKRISRAGGNTRKLDPRELVSKRIYEVESVGKRLIIKLESSALAIHFLMYGSYSIGEKRKEDRYTRLFLELEDGTKIYFYNCSISMLSEDDLARFEELKFLDVTSDRWRRDLVLKLLKERKSELIGDILLDQRVFPGVGNIIRLEALFRAGIHPLSVVGAIPQDILKKLVDEVRRFSLAFYERRISGSRIRDMLMIYGKRNCPRCGSRLIRERTGETKRITIYCERCQKLYR